MWRVSVMMGLQWASLGAWIVTLPTYIAANTGDKGAGIFGESFIGDVGIAGAVGALLSPVVCGLLADRFLNTEHVMAILHGLSAAFLGAACYSQNQTVFFLLLLGYFQAYAPTGALVSSLALRRLPDSAKHFSQVRAVGTVGWVLAGSLVGLWPLIPGQEEIEHTLAPFTIAIALHLMAAAYSLTLPPTPPARTKSSITPAAERLWRNPRVLVFLGISILAAAPARFYEGFVNQYLNYFEFPYPAFLQSGGQAVEVIVMLTIPLLLARFGLKSLFLAGLLCWAARFGLLALSGGNMHPWMVYLSIMLHGFCVVLVLILGQLYIDRLAPADSRSAAQGVYSLAFFGVGTLCGARLSGWSQAVWLTPQGVSPAPYDWTLFWLLPCGMSLAAAALFAIYFIETPHRPASSSES